MINPGSVASPTIRKQLAKLVIACMLPLLIGLCVLVFYFFERERQQLEQTELQTARALSAAVERDLAIGKNVALVLATSSTLADNDLGAFYERASGVLQAGFPGAAFVLSDEGGQQLVNTSVPYGTPLPMHSNPEQLHRVFETGKPVISDVYFGNVLKRPLVSVAVPVWRDGKVAHSLSVVFLPDHFDSMLAEQRRRPDSVIAIFDTKGVLAARSLSPEKFVGQKGTPVLIRRMQEVAEGVVETATLEGIQSILVFTRSSVTGWTVTLGTPKAAILIEIIQSVAILLIIGLTLLTVGFAAAWILGGRIRRSVRNLIAPALALGAGQRVAIPSGDGIKEAQDVAAALLAASVMLRQSETRARALASIVQSSEDTIIGMSNDGIISSWNPGAERLLGYTAAEAVGRSIHLIIPAEIQAEDDGILARVVSGEAIAPFEAVRQHKSGDMVDVSETLSPIHDDSGKVCGISMIARNIADRKQTIRSLLDAKNLAEKAKDLAVELAQAKSAFLASISHEIRTPMNGIIGMVNLALNCELATLPREYIQTIGSSAAAPAAHRQRSLGLLKDRGGTVAHRALRVRP